MTNVRSTTIGPFHDISAVLGPTLSLFFGNFWLITKIVVVIFAPFEIFKALNVEGDEADWQLFSGLFVLELLCRVLVAPALIYALLQVMDTGIAPGVNEAYRWGFNKLGKLIIAATLAFILQALGLMLCIIPGIIVFVSLVLVEPIAVLENGSASGALQSSHELTKGHRWKIFGVSLVIWLLSLIFNAPELITQSWTFARGDLWPFQVAAALFSDIFEQTLTVLSLVLYLSIRALWSQTTQ